MLLFLPYKSTSFSLIIPYLYILYYFFAQKKATIKVAFLFSANKHRFNLQ
nr:MAG TPA: hypothetical protein [Caudoviricetes sp.]DAQ69053.1 MAG TPA: hypothetical protein [Caudoviricetes sp.]